MTRFTPVLDSLEVSLASMTEKNDAGWFRNRPLVDAALAAMVDLYTRARTADDASDQVAVSYLIRRILDVMDKFEAAAGALDG